MKKAIAWGVLALIGFGPAARRVAGEELAQPATPAQPAKPEAAPFSRARIFLNAAFSPGSTSFSQSRTFRLYAEDASIDTQYSADSGLGFELGFHYRFNHRLGAMLSGATTSRDGTVSYSATLPHPLYLDRDRQVSGTDDNVSYHETAVHLDFVYLVQAGALEISLFAGPSWVKVKTDVVSRLNYHDAYPYDEVTITSIDLAEASDDAFGFNVGAGLDYRFGKSRKFGVGAQVRYTAATATVTPPEGPTMNVDAFGFQAAAGIRLFF